MKERIVAKHYKLIERLAVGGMGNIYLGLDMRTNIQVVLKSIRIEFAHRDPQLIPRLQEEATQINQLKHPNLLGIQDIIQQHDEYFLIIPYLGGGTLREKLKMKGQLPITEALHITQQIADGLAALHEINVQHRDLKPENILFDDHAKPHLTDFSKALTSAMQHSTFSGMAVGTLAYLSPEAIQLKPLDARDDIWALGMILYETIAGQRPFMDDSVNQLLAAILNQIPQNLLTIREEVHWAIWELAAWLLEKEVDKRIASASLIQKAVGQILAGDFTPPPIDSKTYTTIFRQKVLA